MVVYKGMKTIMKIKQTSHWKEQMLKGSGKMPSVFCRKTICNLWLSMTLQVALEPVHAWNLSDFCYQLEKTLSFQSDHVIKPTRSSPNLEVEELVTLITPVKSFVSCSITLRNHGSNIWGQGAWGLFYCLITLLRK